MIKGKLKVFTDGGARGNPGPAGIGAVAYEENQKVFEISEYIGETTNNKAEYSALVEAIKKAKQLKYQEAEFFLDSELIVKQLNKEYRVKSKDLQPLFVQVYNNSLYFKKISFKHIPREKNKEADYLVNQAIDNKSK